MYLAASTRPDIMYAVSHLARYVSKPGPVHWTAVKRVLRYLAFTTHAGIMYDRTSMTSPTLKPLGLNLYAYTDASWGDDLDRRRSTIGYIVYVSGCPVAWKSKLSSCVACSTMEAEIIAANEGARELLWVRHVTSEILGLVLDGSTLYCDNAPGIQSMTDRRVTDRTKHIDVKYWFIMDQHEAGTIRLSKVSSRECAADIFTKALANPLFSEQRRFLSVTQCHGLDESGREGGVLAHGTPQPLFG
jgi:hypothetical protein